MVNIVQIALGGVLLAVTAGAAYLMHMFFGLVGAGLFIGMTLGVVGLMAVIFGGTGGGNVDTGARRSKGAREE